VDIQIYLTEKSEQGLKGQNDSEINYLPTMFTTPLFLNDLRVQAASYLLSSHSTTAVSSASSRTFLVAISVAVW
jgi:hypothetical protein